MKYLSILYVVAVLLPLSFSAILPKSGCSVSVNQHLSDPQPLLLLQNGAERALEAFPLPVDRKGTLNFAQGETIDLACPGGKIVINGKATENAVVEAKCNKGINFMILGKQIAFNTIKCTKTPFHTARYTGNKCASNYKEIEVGFIVNNRFIKHLRICFDDVLQHVLYSESDLTSAIGGYQSGYPRPSFITGDFFSVQPNSVDSLYKRDAQRKTINKILGLKESNTSIIKANGDFFLTRGHYTAKADFVYGAQQRSTFYYINVAPQWQVFNGGNWNTMEINTRTLASERDLDLIVYSGSYGISTLPDVNGNEQELYLWVRDNKKGIPVPAFFYRIVYDPISKAGIALIGINNPYKTDVTNDIICTDVCNKVNWLTWKAKDISRGYSYCCEVDDFRKTVPVIPQFEVKSLLV